MIPCIRSTRLRLALLTALFPMSRLQAQAPKIDTHILVARLTALADSLAKRDVLSGVILLAKDGAPVFERAYGFADREAHRANETGTAFNVSSIGKRFTQIAVAQLVAAGKLDLDATIVRVWPDYPNRDVARQVTIRQLLEHRSGIVGDIFQHPETLRRNSDYLPLFVNAPLRFAPGTKVEYSNAGYIVLGEIISRAAGEDYDAYVRQHIFEPAAMTHAGFFARDSLPPFAALGYSRGAGGEHPLERAGREQPRRGSAAGGAYASASDLLALLVAQRAGRLGAPVDARREIIAGGSPGSNGIIAEGLPGGYDLIVLENIDPPAVDAVVSPVMSWLGARAPDQGRRIAAGAHAHAAGDAAKLPDTPAGRVAEHYLRAFNSGDPETMKRFLESEAVSDSTRSVAARVDRYRSIYADNGKLTLTSVDDATPTSITITMSTSHEESLSMTFDVESGAPNRLTSLQLTISRR